MTNNNSILEVLYVVYIIITNDHQKFSNFQIFDFHQKNHSALEELMHANEWICYECSDEGTCTPNIRNSSTRSHVLEGGNRTRNRKQKLQV